jgi:hypothetical protein
MLKAGRNEEILELLRLAPHNFRNNRLWGVKALVALGRKEEAIRYAEAGSDLNDIHHVARACEEILLSDGRTEEAYKQYAIEANQKGTYLATFRAIAAKYPDKSPSTILNDLVESTPGYEGKWFAAARSVGLYAEAIELANRTPCDPKTLTRAAGDLAEKEPAFALEAGMAALRWLSEGYGYEITGLDVRSAYSNTIKASEKLDRKNETVERIRRLASGFVLGVLGRELGL